MSPYYADESVTLYLGDALETLRTLEPGSVDCCVTSPPYFGLRDYGVDGQYGLEASPAEYVETMRAVFAEVRRVLAADGTLWLNIGDSYNTSGTRQGHKGSDAVGEKSHAKWYGGNRTGLPEKNLIGIPWRVAFALQADGWILRNAIVWHKPNAMPESVTDRLASDYELVFLFAKQPRYWFDLDPIREQLAHPDAADGSRVFGGKQNGIGKVGSSFRTAGGMPNTYGGKHKPLEGSHGNVGHDGNGKRYLEKYDSGKGRNPGSVWDMATQPFVEAHFAVMPVTLAQRCISAGCKPGGTVLDPFSGSGTTGLAAARLGRKYVGIDLSVEYLDLSLRTRLQQGALDFGASA